MDTPIIPKAMGVYQVPLDSTQTIVAKQLAIAKDAGTIGSQVKELMERMEETQKSIATNFNVPIKAVAEFNQSVRRLYIWD